MSTSKAWQLDGESARWYEEIAVPLVLGPAARALVDWSAPKPGERVLDVGCGTGIAARYAFQAVGPTGTVTGLDLNAGMLAVAAEIAPGITFLNGNALAIPCAETSFELVICAQVLQFVPNRQAALNEMARVLGPGGRVAVSVWAPQEASPYFDAQVSAVAEYLGNEVAAGLAAGFTLTSLDELAGLLTAAGLFEPDIITATLDLPLGVLVEIIPRHIMATPLAGAFAQAPPETQAQIVRTIAERLVDYRLADGTTTVPFRTILARATRTAA